MQERDMDDTYKHEEDKPTGTLGWEMSSAWVFKRQQKGCGPFSFQFG
jgi:hypothetical protein